MFYLGTKTEVRNHYRGHKMSLWLNLIPQLHQPGLEELSMRHHHFQEEGAQYYDGWLYVPYLLLSFTLIFIIRSITVKYKNLYLTKI